MFNHVNQDRVTIKKKCNKSIMTAKNVNFLRNKYERSIINFIWSQIDKTKKKRVGFLATLFIDKAFRN